MKRHKKAFGIYHWDTFDNEVILIAQADTLEQADEKVSARSGKRINASGADLVEVVDGQGNVVLRFSVS